MAIEEIIPALLVIAVIYYAIRWLMGSGNGTNSDGVTPAMVETIHSAFPDIPVANIVYHLTKTRSAQATSEEILERGFLPAPPAGYQIPPSLAPPAPVSAPATGTGTGTATAINGKLTTVAPGKSLIDRYGLTSRIPSIDKGKGKANETMGNEGGVDGIGKWEASKDERERGLKERKEKMVLEARRRMMERQQAQAQATQADVSPVDAMS